MFCGARHNFIWKYLRTGLYLIGEELKRKVFLPKMNALIDYLRSLREYVKYLRNWRLCIPFLFLYLETVFHLYMKLDMKYIPVFLLLSAAAGMFCSGVLFLYRKRRPWSVEGFWLCPCLYSLLQNVSVRIFYSSIIRYSAEQRQRPAIIWRIMPRLSFSPFWIMWAV